MKRLLRAIVKFKYKYIVKPLLFRLSPDTAHTKTIELITVVQRYRVLRFLIKSSLAETDKSLKTTLCGVTFPSPVGIAAGFDKNGKTIPLMSAIGCGFLTVGSVTAVPRVGNPKPWFHRLPQTGALVVHAGMPNVGVEEAIKNIKSNRHQAKDMPVLFSVAVVARSGEHTSEDAMNDTLNTIKRVEQEGDLVQILEINISCPNVEYKQPFTEPGMLETLLTRIDELHLSHPVFVKIPSTRWEKLEKLLDVAARHNAQGVSIANLTTRRDIEIKDKFDDSIHGGLSGKPCFARSNESIRRTKEKYGDRFVIIGIGGTFTPEDAQAKFDAGADLVALITGMIFEGPQLIGDINHSIK